MIARFAAEQTAGLGCPVLYGVEAGHGTENFTIPFGVVARIDSAARRIRFYRAGRYSLTAVLEDGRWVGVRSSRRSTTRSSMG